jgi:hypothetical protein
VKPGSGVQEHAGGAWEAGEFRLARMVAVVAMTVGWAAFILWDSAMCLRQDCVPVPVTANAVMFAAFFAVIIHAGLLLSFIAERGGAIVRLAGMVLLLPSTLLAFEFARDLLLRAPSADGPTGALVMAYGLAHVVQFWALIGIPFPRLPSLAPLAPEINREG